MIKKKSMRVKQLLSLIFFTAQNKEIDYKIPSLKRRKTLELDSYPGESLINLKPNS